MSTEDPTTEPSIVAATPASTPALTLEARLKAVEDQLREFTSQRPALFAELRTEMASIRADLRVEYQAAIATGLAEEAKKREALEKRIEDLSVALNAKIDAVQGEMGEQTTMLKGLVSDVATIVKSLTGVFANPKVRQYGMSILASITVILGVLATYLAARLNSPPAPAPQQSPPSVTVIVPQKEVPQ